MTPLLHVSQFDGAARGIANKTVAQCEGFRGNFRRRRRWGNKTRRLSGLAAAKLDPLLPLSISAGDRGRVVDVRGRRVEKAALANPCLSLGVDVLPVRQKHDPLPARETTHVDPR